MRWGEVYLSDRYPHHREFTRVPVRLNVRLYGPAGAVYEGAARDVSMQGVYVETECALAANSSCLVEIRLAEHPEGPKIQSSGRVTRVEPCGVAVEFTEIPLDSVDYLRNLVLYNANDPDRVEDEFSAHLGLKRKGSTR